MATLTEPSEAQLAETRDALIRVVLPYQFAGEAPSLWRTLHAALCQVEERLGVPYTLPPREERRSNGKKAAE